MNFKAYEKSGAPLYYVKFNTKTNVLVKNSNCVKTVRKEVVEATFKTTWSRENNARLS